MDREEKLRLLGMDVDDTALLTDKDVDALLKQSRPPEQFIPTDEQEQRFTDQVGAMGESLRRQGYIIPVRPNPFVPNPMVEQEQKKKERGRRLAEKLLENLNRVSMARLGVPRPDVEQDKDLMNFEAKKY